MHRYKQIEYKAGATLEIIKCVPKGLRTGCGRGKRKTKEEITKANMRQAARKLVRKINANFRPGDWHVILTYRKTTRPDRQEARKALSGLLEKLRAEYRKHGFQLKYIHATEYENKAIHHHLIINNVNDGKRTTSDYIRKLWKERGSPKFVGLYDDGEYQKLAEYIVKETEKTFRQPDSPSKQRYSCSRNLITPRPRRRTRTTKKGWDMDPKPRKGYYILPGSLYNGTDKLGYPYQRYTMVKIAPEPSDWEPALWPDEGGG